VKAAWIIADQVRKVLAELQQIPDDAEARLAALEEKATRISWVLL